MCRKPASSETVNSCRARECTACSG